MQIYANCLEVMKLPPIGAFDWIFLFLFFFYEITAETFTVEMEENKIGWTLLSNLGWNVFGLSSETRRHEHEHEHEHEQQSTYTLRFFV